MAHQQEDQNHGQVSSSPSVTPAETDNGTPADKPDKKESSSSSSASSENIDEDDFFQIEGPILGSTLSFADNAAISDIRKQSGSSSGHAPTDPKQSPPVQAMCRAPAADECPDPKRIPSSVFARSKSKSPADWSVTSNESLFSINARNASFSKDHFFLYGKSGDMGNPSDPLAPLPPLPRLSTSSSPMRSEVATAAQASAKLKPAATRVGGDGDDNADYNNNLSHRSDASTTSFAFPILAGDERSSQSLKGDPPELARQSTSQLSQQAEPLVEQEAPKVEDKALEAEQASALDPAAAAATEPTPAPAPAPESTPQPPAASKWFPCCSCCPFCC